MRIGFARLTSGSLATRRVLSKSLDRWRQRFGKISIVDLAGERFGFNQGKRAVGALFFPVGLVVGFQVFLFFFFFFASFFVPLV